MLKFRIKNLELPSCLVCPYLGPAELNLGPVPPHIGNICFSVFLSLVNISPLVTNTGEVLLTRIGLFVQLPALLAYN